jgi:hypothetical protein
VGKSPSPTLAWLQSGNQINRGQYRSRTTRALQPSTYATTSSTKRLTQPCIPSPSPIPFPSVPIPIPLVLPLPLLPSLQLYELLPEPPRYPTMRSFTPAPPITQKPGRNGCRASGKWSPARELPEPDIDGCVIAAWLTKAITVCSTAEARCCRQRLPGENMFQAVIGEYQF